jgi:hypothetical protein
VKFNQADLYLGLADDSMDIGAQPFRQTGHIMRGNILQWLESSNICNLTQN